LDLRQRDLKDEYQEKNKHKPFVQNSMDGREDDKSIPQIYMK
jgi:hypothetical protein